MKMRNSIGVTFKIIFFILSFLLVQSLMATTIESAGCGKWSSSNTWNLGRVPLQDDTILINDFVEFDVDFTSVSPGFLHVEICGTLCGMHHYTGCFKFEGIVFVSYLTSNYGHSISTSTNFNVQYLYTTINVGTTSSVTGGICVGCVSNCQNCETKSKSLSCNTAIIESENVDLDNLLVNPIQDKLIFTNNVTAFEIIVRDIYAKILIQEKINAFKPIDFSTYPNGIYFVELKFGDNRGKVYKVLKSNN